MRLVRINISIPDTFKSSHMQIQRYWKHSLTAVSFTPAEIYEINTHKKQILFAFSSVLYLSVVVLAVSNIQREYSIVKNTFDFQAFR